MIVYTHPDCTYSEALKDELKEAGRAFEEIDLALHPDFWAKLEELTGGERTTPVTVEGELVTIGFHGVG
jgi:glutaredoxin